MPVKLIAAPGARAGAPGLKIIPMRESVTIHCLPDRHKPGASPDISERKTCSLALGATVRSTLSAEIFGVLSTPVKQDEQATADKTAAAARTDILFFCRRFNAKIIIYK
jgi:hypothetical protein